MVFHPTAHPVLPSFANVTEKSMDELSEYFRVQFSPPSVVLRIIPSSPTAPSSDAVVGKGDGVEC